MQVRNLEELQNLGKEREIELWFRPDILEIVSFVLSRDSSTITGFFWDEGRRDESFFLRYRDGSLKLRIDGPLSTEHLPFFRKIRKLEISCSEIPPGLLPQIPTLCLRASDLPLLSSFDQVQILILRGPQYPEDLISILGKMETLVSILEVRGICSRNLSQLQTLVSCFPKARSFSFTGSPTDHALGENISSQFPDILFFQEHRGFFRGGKRAKPNS